MFIFIFNFVKKFDPIQNLNSLMKNVSRYTFNKISHLSQQEPE